MKFRFKSRVSIVYVVFTIQVYLSYCEVGTCASLSKLEQARNPEDKTDDALRTVLKNSSKITLNTSPKHANQTLPVLPDPSPPSDKTKPPPEFSLHLVHLQEQYGHDPFVYSWFSSNQANYLVETVIRNIFKNSDVGNLTDDLLEVFLAGMFASPSFS